MIYHDVEQNTERWHMLRLAKPTASEFDKILTPKKLEPSKQAERYMYRLLAEWIRGTPLYEEQYENRYMQHGQEYQDKAVAAYEGLEEVETAPGGFWTTDDGMAGCSPDRMVGGEGIVEIKCPALSTQVEAAFKGVDHDHICQIQGQLWICERKWVDVYSYEPTLMLPAKRVLRDDKFIQKLQHAVEEFVQEMLLKRADLEREHGPFLRQEEDSPDFIKEDELDAIIRHQRL